MCDTISIENKILYNSIVNAIDSSSSLDEFVSFARGLGFNTIADSERYLVMCNSTEDICVVVDKIAEYVNLYSCCEVRAISI